MISAHTPPDAVVVQSAHLDSTVKSSTALTGHQAKLHPWCIVRLLPNMQQIVVGCFNDSSEVKNPNENSVFF